MSDDTLSPSSRAQRLREVALLFLRLGFTAFGGPAVHIAMMEHEVVQRRKWIDRGHFLDLVTAINFIPGPNSTELAIHLGLIRAGFAGMLLAGVCFIAPAMAIILAIAWSYVTYGTLPQVQGMMRSISAVIVAIVAVAALRLARMTVTYPFAGVILLASIAGAFALRRLGAPQPELIVLAIAACAGIFRAILAAGERFRRSIAPCFLLALPITAPIHPAAELTSITLVFLKIGATLFGSGYLLLSYLQNDLIRERGWMTEAQLLDAMSVGQFTPGPLLTTATFCGYIIGHTHFGAGQGGAVIAAVAATVAIFLPSFVLIALLAPLLDRIRKSEFLRDAFSAMNTAVVGLIVVVLIQLAYAGLQSWIAIAIACVALVVMLLTQINPTWLMVCAMAIGFFIS